MLENLATESTELLYDSVRVLAKTGDASCSGPLSRLYVERKYSLALTALGEIGDPASAKTILPALEEDESGLRGIAAKALGLLGGNRKTAQAIANALLIEKTRTENSRNGDLFFDFPDLVATIYMIEALGRIGDPSTVSLLMPYLDDSRIIKGHRPSGDPYEYPCNCPVSRIALWAINCILTGQPNDEVPRSFDPVKNLPGGAVASHSGKSKSPRLRTIAEAQEWWKGERANPKYLYRDTNRDYDRHD